MIFCFYFINFFVYGGGVKQTQLSLRWI